MLERLGGKAIDSNEMRRKQRNPVDPAPILGPQVNSITNRSSPTKTLHKPFDLCPVSVLFMVAFSYGEQYFWCLLITLLSCGIHYIGVCSEYILVSIGCCYGFVVHVLHPAQSDCLAAAANFLSAVMIAVLCGSSDLVAVHHASKFNTAGFAVVLLLF
ncbi:hypothetical protein RHGRI_026524 [Rhododendron griersonianum]|uniref:Uncharacterized protein n=1 Tax=Rhododendron griersonianum TaxID=479676 RepID=A0AAV6IXN7_9ERIC|nr:hypothetical protein RHGRI_026524 [Rhododendron griersonianum]